MEILNVSFEQIYRDNYTKVFSLIYSAASDWTFAEDMPAPLVIYGWLPKTNCRLCDEQTCLAFAAQLLMGRKALQNCPVIWEPGREDMLESLKDLLGALS